MAATARRHDFWKRSKDRARKIVKKLAHDLTVVNWVPQFLLGVKAFAASEMAAYLHFP